MFPELVGSIPFIIIMLIQLNKVQEIGTDKTTKVNSYNLLYSIETTFLVITFYQNLSIKMQSMEQFKKSNKTFLNKNTHVLQFSSISIGNWILNNNSFFQHRKSSLSSFTNMESQTQKANNKIFLKDKQILYYSLISSLSKVILCTCLF